MTTESLSRLYLLLMVVVLLLGVAVPYFWMEGSILDKVKWGVTLNAEFHVSYLLLSRMPLFAHRRISLRRGPYAANHARQALMIFSWLVMAFSVFGLVDFLNDALKGRDYLQLPFAATYGASFLGAYFVYLKMKTKREELNPPTV